jgi:hypothetical protein
MPDTITPVDIAFGVNFPHPNDLQTGDVLFARVPQSMQESGEVELGDGLSSARLNQKLPDFLGSSLTIMVGTRTGDDRVVLDAVARQAAEVQLQSVIEASLGGVSSDQARMAFLIAILRSEFETLFKDWFNLTVRDFIKNPLAKVLFKALEGDIGDGFFVGHCGLVLCEKDGAHADDGEVYVIEANATSFDHYGVALRRYDLAENATNGQLRYRSWAGFRASRGNSVWSSRHAAFDHMHAADAASVRRLLLQAAQTYIGRSYSFFDSPTFANEDRLYCSELIYRVFDDVREGAHESPAHPGLLNPGSDTRTWKWMKENNPKMKKGDMGDAIQTAWDHPVVGPYVQAADKDFFIMTVQMMWRTQHLSQKFLPGGKPYDE